MATGNTTWNNVPMEGKSINLTLSLPHKDLENILGTTTQWPTSELTPFSPSVFGYSVWSLSFRECLFVWLNIARQWPMRNIPDENIGSFIHLTDFVVQFRLLFLFHMGRSEGVLVESTKVKITHCVNWEVSSQAFNFLRNQHYTGSWKNFKHVFVREDMRVTATYCFRRIIENTVLCLKAVLTTSTILALSERI